MSELRKTGIDVLGDVPWGSHFCNFYDTKQDLLDTVVPYLKAGLENNEFCIWVISSSGLITVKEAKTALEKAVPDLDRRLSDGDVEILNEFDWYLEGNLFHKERVLMAWDLKLKRALALGYEGMRVSGDTFWLDENYLNDFYAYENQVNNFVADLPVTLLCTYPLAKSEATDILDVVRSHQFAITRRQGEWEVIESPEFIQAKAEIKRLNEELKRFKERTPRHSSILRYGVAVLSVMTMLVIAMWMRMKLGQQSTPIVALFLTAIMFSAWFGGIRPGLLAISLSMLAFMYFFFVTPFYTLAVDTREIPRLLIFTISALFIGSLSAAQWNVEESLRKARDALNGTVEQLKLTNEALQVKIAEHKTAEEKVRQAETELRRLNGHLQNIREEERKHIAREIHDELGQQLTAIKMDVVWIDKKMPEETTAIKSKLKNIIGLLDGSNQSVRKILSELRPGILDEHGLLETIEWLRLQFTEATGIPVKFTTTEKNIKVSEQIAICIFRVYQEAFTNITRHSHAKNVSSSISIIEQDIILVIEDNGVGFDTGSVQNKKSFGILGMKERVLALAGKFELITSPGKGSKITVSLPYKV
jgi:signal transduction histidine kinase